MKVFLTTIAYCAGLTIAVAGEFASGFSLDGNWDFRFEEGKSIEAVANVSFAATDRMTVPGCYDSMPKWFLKRGTGLYRRTFHLCRAVTNAWLVVDGIGLRGDFRIDGRSLGVFPYPYAQLEIPTGPLEEGEHELFAAIDNRFDWSTVKLARQYYDFYFYGGFYRGVRLVVDNRKLHVRTRDYATGTVEVEAVNFANVDTEAVLEFDGHNRIPVTFRKGRATVKVPDFRLWSPEHPNLHTVSLDGVFARFGIRTIESRARKLWLNGQELYLKGVNRHDQNFEFGVTVPEAQMLRDLQLIKSLNANFIRGAHYQQSQRFLDLCDEMGMLVWEESLGWGNGQDYVMRDGIDELKVPAFSDAQEWQTRAMVRSSFNHPSVIIFAFLNECSSTRPECKTLVDRLIDTIRAEDSGRLVTFACNHWDGDLCHERTDLIAVNSYPGLIPNCPGLPEELAEKVRRLPGYGFDLIAKHFREKYPDKPIMISECGCGGMYGCHDLAASLGSEEQQCEYLSDVCETILGNPDYVGYAVWQFADTRTYHRNSNIEPAKFLGISIAGLVDAQRRPKKSFDVVRRFFGER